ncbi:MAG: alpha/beta hydrolase [Pseudomonadota bacterium]
MPRMVTTLLVLAALAGAVMLLTKWRASAVVQQIEAAYPPQGQIITVDGRDVHVIVAGSGPDLVLIHGAGGNAQDFTHAFTARLTERYRVFAVDRPGLGYTDRADTGLDAAWTTKAETPTEQARLLAAATRQLGAERPLVLGHSYGASVAMAWALDEPASGIVVLSGATMPWPGPLQPYYRVFGSLLGSALAAPLVTAFVPEARVRRSLEGVFAPAPVDPTYFEGAAVPLAIRTDTFRANARQVKSLRPTLVEKSARYPEITLPVEILHGTADTTVRTEIHAEPLANSLSNAVLTVLDGVGHAPHQTHPEPVVAAIDRVATRAGLR